MKITNKLKHLAIIMDGNGRWALLNLKKRSFGHKNGCNIAIKIIKCAIKKNINYLTLYIFSYENWKRSRSEVSILMNIIYNYLLKQCKIFFKKKIKFCTIGDKIKLSIKVRKKINDLEHVSS